MTTTSVEIQTAEESGAHGARTAADRDINSLLSEAVRNTPIDVLSQHQALLTAEVGRAGLNFEGRPYPVSLRPYALDEHSAKSIATIAERFVALLDVAAHVYCEDAEVRSLFPAYRNVERFATALPALKPIAQICRLDGLVTETGIYKILETNTDCPGGVIQNGLAAGIWSKMNNPLRAGLNLTTSDQPFVADPDFFLKSLLAAHEQRTDRPARSASIVTFRGRFTNEVRQMVEGLNRLGVVTTTDDAATLRVVGHQVITSDGRPIDLAYNKLDLRDLIDDPSIEEYLDAAAQGYVTFLSPLICMWPLADKAVLALLSDPRFADRFSAEDRAFCARHVPWTRFMVDGITTALTGESVDLFSYVLTNRTSLVLKPSNATRGQGVIVGPKVTQQEWESRLAEAIQDTPHVVQEYIAPKELSVLHPDSAQVGTMWSGLDTYVFGGNFAGFQARASLDPVMNVGQRGILMPVTIHKG